MKKAAWIISLVSLIATAVIIWMHPQDTVPIHYDIFGQADNWGNKWVWMVFAFFPVLLCAIFAIYNKATKNNINIQKNKKVENIIIPAIIFIFVLFNWIFMIPIYSPKIEMQHVVYFIPMVLGALMIVMGNFMGKLRQNKTFGIKVKWTLKNETVWKKTHRFYGIFAVVTGFLIILWSFICLIFSWQLALFIGFLILMLVPIIITTIYSYKLYSKLENI